MKEFKELRKVIYEKTILFLQGIFGANRFELFLLDIEIKANECIAHGKFIEERYKEIQNDPDFTWIM